jgi:hypothetical protein
VNNAIQETADNQTENKNKSCDYGGNHIFILALIGIIGKQNR